MNYNSSKYANKDKFERASSVVTTKGQKVLGAPALEDGSELKLYKKFSAETKSDEELVDLIYEALGGAFMTPELEAAVNKRKEALARAKNKKRS